MAAIDIFVETQNFASPTRQADLQGWICMRETQNFASLY